MLTIINILNIVIITTIIINAIIIYLKYRNYKTLYGKHHKNLFTKEIQKKFVYCLPAEKGKQYKKIKKKLFESGWDISVYKYMFIKYALLTLGLIFFVNVALTDKISRISEIIGNINYGKLSTDIRLKPTEEEKTKEKEVYHELSATIDANKINEKNMNKYIVDSRRYIEESSYTGSEGSEIIARRMLQKLIDIKTIESGMDEYMLSILIAILMYFIPDILCFLRQYLIEDKKQWEVIISIFTYCIFAKIPPYRTSIIVDNIIEVSDVYKKTFEKISYSIKNGKGEETINEMIRDNRLEDEMLELLETIKLTITTGVESTVQNMESLAENAIEWQKIKQINKRNKKYLILIPLLLLILMLCFDYVMYGLTEIITNFKIDM
ncbi:MAG TPA: hypothetical protein DEP72_05820 [Clostridiales bacterium]|nr:MAG: hypothetical protein A2Y18_06295 [Clostridiales bacterium GWD2_32_19]HCC07659.1 hypothetical protein [Clostridiales bacterium]